MENVDFREGEGGGGGGGGEEKKTFFTNPTRQFCGIVTFDIAYKITLQMYAVILQ